MSVAPPVNLALERLLCPEHGEHLRVGWPRGYALIALRLMHEAIGGVELAAAVLELHPGVDQPDPLWINEVTDRRPLCFFVAEHVVLGALLDSGLGRLVVCGGCGVPRLGGPYLLGSSRLVDLCFVCACERGARRHVACPGGRPW